MKIPTILTQSILSVMAVSILPSCTVLRTVNAPVGSSNTGRAYAGLHYFLPRGIITITGVPGTADDFKITATMEMKADKASRYRLVPSVNGLYDDTSKFKVDADGLIEGAVTNTSVPKLAEIIKTLGETAVIVGKIVIKLNTPGGAVRDRSKLPETTDLKRFTVSFDPFDGQDIANAIQQMENAGLKLDVVNGYDKHGNVTTPSTVNSLPEKGMSMQGIVYRPQTTVKLRIVAADDKEEILAHTFIASVPDPNSIATYSLGRSILAAKKNTPTFVHGVLTEIDYSYDSEVLATARFAKGVAEQALGILNDAPDVVGLIYKPKPPVDPNADLNSEIKRLEREKTRIDLQNEIIRKRKENEELKKNDQTSTNPVEGAEASTPSRGREEDRSVVKTGPDEGKKKAPEVGIPLPEARLI